MAATKGLSRRHARKGASLVEWTFHFIIFYTVLSFFVLVYLGGRNRVQNDHNHNNEDDLMEKVHLGDMHRMMPSRRQDQEPAFAACLLVLDDTIRLNEWVAYHFTELPLSSLIIGLDPKSSMSSIAEIYSMSQRWSPYGLNITVWPTNPFPKTFKYISPNKRPPGSHKWRQETLALSCTHHFLDKGEEEWLLLTDTDEFLSYNFIQPGENISSFDKNSVFRGPRAPSLEKRAADRVKALPIRRKALAFSAQGLTTKTNNTILSFIQAQRASNSSHGYFPSQSGCTRIVGLTYGTNESTSSDVKKFENLMTKRYQQHSKFFNDRFSTVMIELPKIKEDRNELGWVESIHNPFPRLCGSNGKHSSGQDFMGSVLKVAHYVGSVESWLERGFGNGTNIRKQDISEWKKRDLQGASYTDQFDTRMGSWYEKFEAKVGKDGAEKLLLHPIQERIEYVRSKLQLSQSMTDQGPGKEKSIHYCGHRKWMDTTMSCDQRVRFLTRGYQMTIDDARQSAVNDNCTCDGEHLGEKDRDDDINKMKLPDDWKNMIDPSHHPHIDSKTRSLLDIKPFFHGKEAVSRSGVITAVTQMTAGTAKLQRLQDLASRWSDDGGYISVAIYVPDEVAANSTSKSLRTYFQENSVLFKRTVVQLVIDERPKGNDDESNGRSPHEYPVNIMRNIAMDSAPTDHIIYIDVDFIPSIGAHSHLVKQFSLMDASTSKKKMALIVPAFERKLSKYEDDSSSIESFLLPPQKSDLLRLVTGSGSNNIIAPFHLKRFSEGHGPTEYRRWYTAAEPYKVEYAYGFEPYFVINKESVPPFWEFFRGMHFNKLSWVGELSLAGYTFHVDPSCFLIHINHKYFKDRKQEMRQHEKKMTQEFEMRFNNGYLRETYGRILEKQDQKADVILSLPQNDKAFVASGEEGSLFSRVYYRANTTHCFGGSKQKGTSDTVWVWMIIPAFADGVAAGPIIDCAPNDDVSCDLESALSDLEVIQSLRRGQSFQFFLPQQDPGVHNAVVITRARMSSSTGVVFLDENHLAVASYGMKRIYLYQYDLVGSKSARLLASVNTSGNPDLIHVDHKRNMLVISQLMKGTQQLFKYDLERKSLEVFKEVYAFGPKVKQQWCHEAAFYPSDTSSIIAAASSKLLDEKNLMISIFDYMHERVIAQYLMMANDATRGYRAQGLRFVDERHMLLSLSRARVSTYKEKQMCQRGPHLDPSDAHTRIALIRLEFSVDDIASGKVEPVSSASFSVIGVHDIGIGALDGVDYHDGMAMVADQLNDRVMFFEVNPRARNETLKLVSQHRGYIMPHGVALSKSRDHFAVTTYGENSVIVSHKDSIRALSRDGLSEWEMGRQ